MRVRPTSLGTATGMASVSLLGLGYELGYLSIAAVGIGGLAALALAAAVTLRRPRVRMNREVFPARVTRGEPAIGRLTVQNCSCWGWLRIDACERFGGRDIPVPVPRLGRRATQEISYRLPTTHRGVVEVGPARWERTDPLGLVRRWQPFAGTVRLYVHPATHPFPLGSTLRSRHWDSTGGDAAREGTIAFHTLREYVPGDDRRQIHWRSSARLGLLMVRKNIDASAPRATVLLVTDPAAYRVPDQFEEAVEVAASAVVAAAQQRLPARMLTSDGMTMSTASGRGGTRLLLDFLAEVQMRDDGGLVSAAHRLGHAETGGLLLVATGSLDHPGRTALQRAAARYDDAVVAVLGDMPAPPDRGSGLPLRIVAAASGADFCRRWSERAAR